MLLSEMIQRLMVRSGLYVLESLEMLGLDIDTLYPTLDEEVIYYEQFFPLKKEFNIVLYPDQGNGSAHHDFTHSEHNPGYSRDNPFTHSSTKALIATPTQTWTVSTGRTDMTPGSLTLSVNSTPAAVDEAGTLIFGVGFEDYSGSVNYDTGVLTLTRTDVGSPITIQLSLEGQYTLFGNPPEFVSKTLPVGFRQSMTNWFVQRRTNYFPAQAGRVPTPRNILIDYRKPVLYVSEPGRMDIEACYRRYRTVTYDELDTTKVVDVRYHDLDTDKRLTDLLQGRFMQLVGGAFNLAEHQDLPITVNSGDMISKGTAIYDAAKEEIHNGQQWWKAIRP